MTQTVVQTFKCTSDLTFLHFYRFRHVLAPSTIHNSINTCLTCSVSELEQPQGGDKAVVSRSKSSDQNVPALVTLKTVLRIDDDEPCTSLLTTSFTPNPLLTTLLSVEQEAELRFLPNHDGSLRFKMPEKFERDDDSIDSREDALRQYHYSSEITVIMRAIDYLGVEAEGTESHLHERFPDSIPRFWHNRYSELLVIDEDQLDPSSHYYCFEIPVQHQATPPTLDQDPGNDDEKVSNETRSKRSKTSLSEPCNSMKIYVPHFIVELYDLMPTFESLKHSARQTKVLVGFVVSLLGGVLHLSYPPTLDEAKLYCEIIVLHEHYGLRMDDSFKTFTSVLKDLQLPLQPVPIPSCSQMLIELIEFVWVMCSQNLTCLRPLLPHLSNNSAAADLLKRLGPLTSLNADLFIQLVRGTIKYNDYPWETSNLKYADKRGKKLLAKGFSFDDETFAFEEELEASSIIPSHLFTFTSSLPADDKKDDDDNDPPKPKMRYLAHRDLLLWQWPYFKRLIESGLSEAQTQLIELPLSEHSIKLLLTCFYNDDWHELYPENAFELIETGPQFGLYESLEFTSGHAPYGHRFSATKVPPTFKQLMDRSIRSIFLHPKAEGLNFAHSHGYHDFWKEELQTRDKRRLDELRNAKNLHPDIVAALPGTNQGARR